MPRVVIPAILRQFTAGATEVQASGATLRSVIEDLERQQPALKGRVLSDGVLRPEVFVAIGSVEAFGLDAPVEADAEVFILPAIAGGSH
jgi:molybdopterin converting factor small subunit